MNTFQWIAAIGVGDLLVTAIFCLFFRGADERRDEPAQPTRQLEAQQ